MKAEDQSANNGIILLDIGNTNLKWAWLQDGQLGAITRVTHRGKDITALAASEWSTLTAPGQVYISSVARRSRENDLADWIREHWDLEPRFIRSSAQACGVINAYREPGRLGVDRWLSMIALHTKAPGPTCVVDCGTAVTIDAIGLGGRHLGGLILPGFDLMRQALAEHTSISFAATAQAEGLLAADTESAIAAGGVNAVAALVERIAHKVATDCGVTVEPVLTGGDAEILHNALNLPSRIETGLVLQGLVAIIKNGTD